jgi:hypothetical protein
MKENLLVALNEITYSNEELKQIEDEIDNEDIDMDKYYVRNSKLIKKIAIKTMEDSIRINFLEGEAFEKSLLVDQGYFGNNNTIPSGMIADSIVYYYILLTNNRIFIIGLNQFFKQVVKYIESIENIIQVSEDWKVRNVCQIVFDNYYIDLTSQDNKDELIELINLLIQKGVQKKSITIVLKEVGILPLL